MSRLHGYLAALPIGRTILWCYAIWYAVNVAFHFDPSPRLWLTSLGLAAIIGAALILSTRTTQGPMRPLDSWVTFRLFLMPFCVSSFAALVKDAGYVLVFPPSLGENATGFGAIAAFVLVVVVAKRTARPAAVNG
ncbi:MAG: hypothetical protein KF830_03730 [Planctomycetes bacterium]|nr:hypothetical protein [Planctomycetota bacterium]